MDETMKARIECGKWAPGVREAVRGLEKYVESTGLPRSLLHLVKMRASQMNGCTHCIDLHTVEAVAEGESPRRLMQLDAWRESPFFTEKERAILPWTEAVTLVSQTHVPDAVYEETRRHFSDKELVDLTLAVVAINDWNRLAISFRIPPDAHWPRSERATSSPMTADPLAHA